MKDKRILEAVSRFSDSYEPALTADDVPRALLNEAGRDALRRMRNENGGNRRKRRTGRIVLAVGVFVVGWVLQFIGPWFEGRKPAFFDELVSLLIGPLFIVAEVLFALGLFPALKQAVAQRTAAQQPPARRQAA